MMKKIFFVSVVALMICSTVSAQFTNNSRSISSSVRTEGWNDIYVQYNTLKNGAYDDLDKYVDLDKDTKKEYSGKANGFTIGYNRAISVSSQIPLYLLLGGAIEYNFKSVEYTKKESYSKDEYEYDSSGKAISLKVPLSVTYHHCINDILAIEPFAGLNARYYISSSLKEKKTCYYYYDDDHKINKKKGYESRKGDIFDKDNDENPANRFIIGGQIGLTAVFSNRFTATLSYDRDFTKIHDDFDDKCYRINLGLGFRF